MPCPVSCTVMRTSSAMGRAAISMRPSLSTASRALATRFTTICRSRPGSVTRSPSAGSTFQVTATSSVSPNLVSAPATVTVIVQPATDTIVISNVVYRRTKGRLIVNCSDFTPGVTLTATLDIINPATGLQWQGVMGPIIPFAQGVFSLRFSNIPPPNLVTITSDAGGSAQSGITFLR